MPVPKGLPFNRSYSKALLMIVKFDELKSSESESSNSSSLLIVGVSRIRAFIHDDMLIGL
uniref:Uncharacterized protein n=1 Tax=Megaselia scalaris TaxID=36166 RepID=T1GG24_MEGSC